MLEDTNSLDGAHMKNCFSVFRVLPYSTVDMFVCLGRPVSVSVHATINKDRLHVSKMAEEKQT